MKRIFRNLMPLIIGLAISSCGNSSSKFAESFSGEDLKAVKLTEKSLPRGSKIEECKVVKDKLPLALLDTEYKSVRDEVFKARLDYQNCIKRGLNEPAQKNIEILKSAQSLICEKAANLEDSSPEYLFVLAKVKEKTQSGKLAGYICIYQPGSLEQVDYIPVTRPLYNNAIMVEQALDGSLSDPASYQNEESITSKNPIVEFILSCDPK